MKKKEEEKKDEKKKDIQNDMLDPVTKVIAKFDKELQEWELIQLAVGKEEQEEIKPTTKRDNKITEKLRR